MREPSFALLLLLPLMAGCGSGASTSNQGADGVSVELGVPGGVDGLEFTPLGDGAVLRLETFGQGGTHVLLAVRTIGFGARAFVSLRAKNSLSGIEFTAPAPARPQLLYCVDETCDLVPITMMMGGIAPSDDERDGLAVELTAEVHNAVGTAGQCVRQAVLSTEDL
jgi:hypothetical protein